MCLWYEELEPVLRDRPMARTMVSQDLDIKAFTPNQATQDSRGLDGDDSEVYEGWIPTPPRYPPDANVTEEADVWLDPNLISTQPNPPP